jgi:hypothetical protein
VRGSKGDWARVGRADIKLCGEKPELKSSCTNTDGLRVKNDLVKDRQSDRSNRDMKM